MATIKSIEEKARRYDEAIEKLRSLHDNYDTVSTLIDIKEELENIFPELKESEDERIIERIKKAVESYWSDEPLDEILAWLEKQGETFTKKDVDDAYLKGVCDTKHELEKQGEQKPNPCENCSIATNNCQKFPCAIRDGEQKPVEDIERKYNPCYNMSFEEAQEYISNRRFDIPWTDCDVFVDFRYVTQTVANILRWADDNPRQKPAWSVEDEDILNTIINHFKIDIECTDEDDMVRWLKSLKDRVQPKQEWSEEDEKMCQETIDWFEYKCFPYALESENPAKESIKWLKSLKDRYTWKPSDEQMEALNYVVNLMASSERPTENDLYYNILKGLRQQLKKLREE